MFVFEVVLEIKEDDGKGGYSSCPKDKNCFKLRRSLEKKLVLCVQQTSGFRELIIERYRMFVSACQLEHQANSYIKIVKCDT